MARSLTDPVEQPKDPNEVEPTFKEEVEQIIKSLIVGQNKLHDRLIDLERKLDHLTYDTQPEHEASAKVRNKPWRNGL